jgi:hypothetical protein
MKIKATILIIPPAITAPQPELATAAPIKPPTSVCDELDGNPSHQVIRFHVNAAIRAAPITLRLIISGSTTFVPIVSATLVLNTRKAMKLKNAAITTAANGDNTFVETMQAMEFAESWNPLIKSKTITNAIIIARNVIRPSL